MGHRLKKLFEKMLDILFPKGLCCISCDRELNDEQREFALCDRCAEMLVVSKKQTKIAQDVEVYSCFHYETVTRQLVLSYKDSEKPFLTEYIAKFMKEKYLARKLQADGIVFVPSSVKKINKRGYDALKLVAEHMSKMLSLPILEGLDKIDVSTDLTEIKKEMRKKAIKDTFFVKENHQLLGKKVLLIDDVITTGATLSECVKELRKAGVKDIKIITFTTALQ